MNSQFLQPLQEVLAAQGIPDNIAVNPNGAGITHLTAANIDASTTAGRNVLNVTNPGAISFLKISATNTVLTRTPTEVRSDIVAEPVQTAASQAEAEAGTETALRSFSPVRVKQAIVALAPVPTTPGLPTVIAVASGAEGATLAGTTLSALFVVEGAVDAANLPVAGTALGTVLAGKLAVNGDGGGLTNVTATQLNVGTAFFTLQSFGEIVAWAPVADTRISSADGNTYLDNSGFHGALVGNADTAAALTGASMMDTFAHDNTEGFQGFYPSNAIDRVGSQDKGTYLYNNGFITSGDMRAVNFYANGSVGVTEDVTVLLAGGILTTVLHFIAGIYTGRD